MLELKKEDISKINNKPFGIILFYAEGCHHCQRIKPIFDSYSEQYPEIQFAKIEMTDGLEYYNKFAEEDQDVIYETVKDANGNEIRDENDKPIINIVPQFNEDGSPKMTKKYAIPAFYVHHVEAIAENNEFGFVGGFSGALEDELKMVCEQIMSYGNQDE